MHHTCVDCTAVVRVAILPVVIAVVVEVVVVVHALALITVTAAVAAAVDAATVTLHSSDPPPVWMVDQRQRGHTRGGWGDTFFS